MKRLVTLKLIILLACGMYAQAPDSLRVGEVSYLSASNIYVKFPSTEGMQTGDTLYLRSDTDFIPAMVIANKSSMSCVGDPIGEIRVAVGDNLVYLESRHVKRELDKETVKIVESVEPQLGNDVTAPVVPPEDLHEEEGAEFRSRTSGRISASSYSNFSDYRNVHRLRYTLAYRGDHLENSRFSTDNYISFRHTVGEWEDVRDNLGNALKIYSLSAQYHFNEGTHLTLGRKINHRISSMGAIDGLQFEKDFGGFLIGAIGGSRPDMQDYGINLDLLQAGLYIGHHSQNGSRYQQSTLAIVEQRNGANTDRRFLYVQHSNSLFEKVNLFTSFEFDLYESIKGNQHSTLNLTNFYVSFRYRLSKKVSLSASYDARNNIIYYESYKSFIEQMIDDETRQGLRVGANVRPSRYMVVGLNGSLRFQKDGQNTSRNVHGYLNFSKVPLLNGSASVTANLLQTDYIDSWIIGLRLSKEIVKQKVNADLYAKMVNYMYRNAEFTTRQKVVGANLTFRLTKKLGLYVYYEGTFDNRQNDHTRLNTKVIQRF